jgi:hypothetical protein
VVTALTSNANVTILSGSILASSDTAKSEERQMKKARIMYNLGRIDC